MSESGQNTPSTPDIAVLAANLRAAQKPVKQAYRDDPTKAIVPTRASAVVDQATVSATFTSAAGDIVAGIHPAGGGTGALACSADILLQALAGCAGVTLAAVATSMGITLHRADVTATGQWDARGTLGVDRNAPVGVTGIEITVDLDSDADEKQVATLLDLTERYCVVAQTLTTPTEVSIRRA